MEEKPLWTDEHIASLKAYKLGGWIYCPGCIDRQHERLIREENGRCQDCGGPPTNCRTCGTGSSYWSKTGWGPFTKYRCPVCEGDPLKAGDGRPDRSEWTRARMVKRLGPRIEGDEALIERYRDELQRRGY